MKKPLTLDLAENARYSLHFLSHNLDPGYHHYTLHKAIYDLNPVCEQHTLWDHCETPGRYLYGIMFARQLVGLDAARGAAEKIKHNLYRRFDEGDGLCYRPRRHPFGDYPEFPPQDVIPLLHEADMWDNRSVLMGLLLAGATGGDRKAMRYAQKMVRAFARVSVKKGDERYLCRPAIPPGYRPSAGEKPFEGEYMYGWITPLFRYYTLTGDKEALAMATELANFTVRRAELDHRGILKKKVNNHSILFCLAGIIRCAIHNDNREHVRWCRKMYDRLLREMGSSIGWIAEHPDDSKLDYPGATQSGETCTTVDLLDTAIRLAQAGYPEYWNHVERYARNYLQEGQLKDVSWMRSTRTVERTTKKFYYDNVPEMIKGCYVGWGAANDFVNPTARKSGLHAIQHCCGPHGAMGNFLVWHHIVTRDKDGVSVNLAISRDSKWAEINSWLPHQGRLDVAMHVTDRLKIRVPDWAKKSQVKLLINGKPQKTKIGKDSYISAGEVASGTTVSVRYPLRQVKTAENIYGNTYVLEWRGDTVVSIDPPGRVHPFFNRTHLKTTKAPTGKITRYYPENEIDW